MIQARRLAVLGVYVLLAACVQSGGRPGPTPPAQQSGGAVYTAMASVDRADAPGAVAAANKTFSAPTGFGSNNAAGNAAGDARPAKNFRYYFVHAVQEAKAQRVAMAGSGTNPASAFFAHDVAERLELQAAMNDLLARYPDRHNVSCVLQRGTNRKYVAAVTFIGGGASRTLYYDVTRWVDYARVHG